MTGAAPVPVPPPMPAVNEHHIGARQMIANFVDDFLGRGCADIRLRNRRRGPG